VTLSSAEHTHRRQKNITIKMHWQLRHQPEIHVADRKISLLKCTGNFCHQLDIHVADRKISLLKCTGDFVIGWIYTSLTEKYHY